MSFDSRIESLEQQVMMLRRLIYGLLTVLFVGALLAAQVPSALKQDEMPLKIQLVGPIKVDGVGAVVNHTVNWDGIGDLPVRVRGDVGVVGDVGVPGDVGVSDPHGSTLRVRVID